MKSLQASIAPLSEILKLNPHALYERQLALVRAGLLESRPGRGPGSGTRFTPETVAVLLISMLATDNISDCAEKTSALSAVKLTNLGTGRENALGGARTFKAAIINALSSDAIVSEISFVQVHRRNFVVEIFLESNEIFKEPPAGKIFTDFELELAHDRNAAHIFGLKRKVNSEDFEGMVVVVQIRGGTRVGYPGGGPALGKVRALLRSSEVLAAEAPARKNAARRSKSKDHRK
jgi:hypothetical protein